MIRSKDDDQAPVGPADVADDEGFLERWSRRKAEAMEAPTESAETAVSEADAGDDGEVVAGDSGKGEAAAADEPPQ